MNTLCIFTKSPWARRDMEEWLPRLDARDGVLLIQDAVLAIKGAPAGVREALQGVRGRLFALEADLVARGIAANEARIVDDAGAVDLLAGHERVLAL